MAKKKTIAYLLSLPQDIQRKYDQGFCITPSCTHHRRPGRFLCGTCTSRKHRKHYIIQDKFYNLKVSARRRNISFHLTLEQFTDWCLKTLYHEKTNGLDPDGASVDRIDANRGYEIGNIQLLTVGENSRKRSKETKWLVDENVPF